MRLCFRLYCSSSIKTKNLIREFIANIPGRDMRQKPDQSKLDEFVLIQARKWGILHELKAYCTSRITRFPDSQYSSMKMG